MSLNKSGGVRLLVILAMALLVGLVGIAPAGAVVDTSFTCPDSIEAAGFVDIGGHDQTTQRAIDCLAVHGITKGTGPDTFEPGGTVPRWQMALFLVRQSAAHGVTIPVAADQGFEDLDGLSAEARDAVNQLGQLGITLGTSETTFSPHEDVTRWQMALFITRLLAGSGVSLPTAVDQGFGDLDGLSDQAQAAIDQLATLGIAAGTSSSTFSPFTETLRWHMALFLTRALAVAGILPPGVGAIDVTPSANAFLDFSGSAVSRQYTAAVSMEGPFSIELWPASLIRADGSFEAPAPGSIANCDITLVDGGSYSADRVTGIQPNGTTFAFTVGCTGLQSRIVPVVYAGASLVGLDEANSSSAKTPTNAYGIGGGVTVVAEATAELFGPVEVESIDKKDGSFTSGGVTYFWDSDDIFKIGGVVVTLAEWVAALTTGDDMLAGSVYDPDGSSIFDLQDDSPVAPGLSLLAVTSTAATLTYEAAAGSDHVTVYSCEGTGCATSLSRTVVNGLDEDPTTAGNQLVMAGLTPSTDYDFQATQTEDTNESPKSPAVDVDTPVALSIESLAVNAVNDGQGLWSSLIVIFDQAVAYPSGVSVSDFQINTVADPTVKISATMLLSRTASNELELVFPTREDPEEDIDWVLTIGEGALDVAGNPNGLLTAVFSH